MFIFLNFNELKENKLNKQNELQNNSLNEEIELSLDLEKSNDDLSKNNQVAIPKVLPEREKEILDIFYKSYFDKKDDFVALDNLEKILNDLAEIDGEKKQKNLEEIPGSFYFYEDYVSFYVVYKKLVGEEIAKKNYQHEMEHYVVLKKYNVSACFTIFIAKVNDELMILPAIISNYPDNFLKEKIKKIEFESKNNVQEKSESDQKVLDNYYENN